MAQYLLIVDPQIDFISGSLPVPGAANAMNRLTNYLEKTNGKYASKIVTMDFHPFDHSSFSENGGQWPSHCTQWSYGAAIWPDLLTALYKTKGDVIFVQKGQEKNREEYSIFQNEISRKKLTGILKPGDKVDICGLAGDVCVLNTLKDGIGIFGSEMFNVLEDFSPSLDGGKALSDFMRGM